eukprot:4836671-Prorocentrum_lima.AAC.1
MEHCFGTPWGQDHTPGDAPPNDAVAAAARVLWDWRLAWPLSAQRALGAWIHSEGYERGRNPAGRHNGLSASHSGLWSTW